jgi:hypothetical protein
MKFYEKPEMEIDIYKTEDVICDSNGNVGGDGNGDDEGYQTPEV